MLLNAVKGQAFTVSELLQENQKGGMGVKLPPPGGGGGKIPHPPTPD